MERSSSSIIAFLSLAAIPAALGAAPSANSETVAHEAELRKALDMAVEAMFTPGELDPHWNRGGIDLEQAVKARPNHVLVEVDKDGDRSVAIYSDRPVAEFIPPEWELLAEIGTDQAQSERSPIEISELDDGYYVASRSPYWRVGEASCSNFPTSARLYKAKGAAETEMPPEIAKFIFREMLERAKPYTVCTRHDVVGEGYGTRYFFKDGRSLPFFDDRSGKSTIVPMRPISDLLKAE